MSAVFPKAIQKSSPSTDDFFLLFYNLVRDYLLLCDSCLLLLRCCCNLVHLKQQTGCSQKSISWRCTAESYQTKSFLADSATAVSHASLAWVSMLLSSQMERWERSYLTYCPRKYQVTSAGRFSLRSVNIVWPLLHYTDDPTQAISSPCLSLSVLQQLTPVCWS